MTKNWISIHIFYASNANPMLIEALEPLVNDLRERGLIRRYFFIKFLDPIGGAIIESSQGPKSVPLPEEAKKRITRAITKSLEEEISTKAK